MACMYGTWHWPPRVASPRYLICPAFVFSCSCSCSCSSCCYGGAHQGGGRGSGYHG